MCHIITWTGEKKQNCEVRMQIFLLPRHSMYVRWNVSIVKYGCIYIDLYYNPTLGLKYSPDSKWKITNLLSYSVASPQKYSPVWQYSQRFFVILEYNPYPFIIRTLGRLPDFEVTNCQPFLLLYSALICFLGISYVPQR